MHVSVVAVSADLGSAVSSAKRKNVVGWGPLFPSRTALA